MECFRRAAKKRREIVELRREDARRGAGIEIHPPTASNPQKQGCICQISLRGVEVLAIEVDDRANA